MICDIEINVAAPYYYSIFIINRNDIPGRVFLFLKYYANVGVPLLLCYWLLLSLLDSFFLTQPTFLPGLDLYGNEEVQANQ